MFETNNKPLVKICTEYGDISVAIDIGKARITGANFLNYVDQELFDGRGFSES